MFLALILSSWSFTQAAWGQNEGMLAAQLAPEKPNMMWSVFV